MKRKNLISIAAFLSVFLFANYTVYKTAGSHPGSTGAPGDKTCAQKGCHEDASVVINPVGVNTFNFSSIDSSYIPGQTYTLTINVQKPATTKFGFELVALKDADTTDTGLLILIDAVRTQLINSVASNGSRNSITHKTAGTPALSTNSTQWAFKWVAPSIGTGPVTFYYATNCTNDNGANTGDAIYLSSFKIKEKGAISVKENSNISDLKFYYDNNSREIILNYNIKGEHSVKLKAYDNGGKLICEIPASNFSGQQNGKLRMPDNLAKGAYLIQLIIDNQKTTTKKIIIF